MSSVEVQGSWAWTLNRLRCMTLAEIAHRLMVAARSGAWRLCGCALTRVEHADRAMPPVRWIGIPVGAESTPYVVAAKRIASGEVRLFSSAHHAVGLPPNWNRCPLTGIQAPVLPSDRISLTDRMQVGDIKFVWELNRHLHWVTLAQAHAMTGDAQPLQVLEQQLESWLDQCPPWVGPNWTSSLELGLRLVNWSVVWQLIGGQTSALFNGARGAALLDRWLVSVQHHVLGIANNYSRHSSANNHLIGELAGVFVAACTWSCWPRVRALGERARLELEREIQLQITTDGVLREQAFEYATFVYDFFAVVERAAVAVGRPMSDAFADRMAAMCCFLRSVMAVGGYVPEVGDADGARVLQLHAGDRHHGFAAMLHKGAWLFGRDDWVADLGAVGREEADWLYAGSTCPLMPTARQPALSFPEGGYELFVSGPATSDEVKGLVDVGPLGYLGIAAHGHADALQVCLSIAGRPLLADPGTYAYWCERPWRDYFRSTAAHNTVRIAGQDQSVSGGRFMWTRKARVHDLSVQRESGGAVRLSAGHDGYARLGSRFGHRRTVDFRPDSSKLQVDDSLAGQHAELLELHWHIHPSWSANLEGRVLRLNDGRRAVALEVNLVSGQVEGERLDLVKGQSDPPLGWYSEAYNEKQPSFVLRWCGRSAAVALRTVIHW